MLADVADARLQQELERAHAFAELAREASRRARECEPILRERERDARAAREARDRELTQIELRNRAAELVSRPVTAGCALYAACRIHGNLQHGCSGPACWFGAT